MLQKYMRAAFLFQVSSSWAFSLAPLTQIHSVNLGQSKVATPAFAKRSVSFTPPLRMADDDDFYSDYDPSQYERVNKPDYNEGYGNRGGGGGGYERGGGGGYGGGGGGYERGGSRGGGGRGGGGYGGGGRGGGRNFEYTRDTSRDSSTVDEATVLDLLEQRSQAKRTRDFETADAIRDDLLQNYSVGVDDRERSWRSGCSPSGSGMRFGGGGSRGGGGRGRSRDFGPNGHDYMNSQDTGPNTSSFTEDQIHAMLADRLQAKMNRDFPTADGIQIDLMNAGVFVHDGMKEWRADGVAFGDIGGGRGPGRTEGSHSDRNRPYEKSIHSADVEGGDDDTVNKLVGERFKYKIMRDYNKADSIREGLRTQFNVLIDDKLREWSVDGDFGEEHNAQRQMATEFANRDYAKSTFSLPVEEVDQETIQALVNERTVVKKARNFQEADDIREDLAERFDVSINDKIKEWSVGGSFGGRAGGEYVLSSSSAPVDENDMKIIQDALKQRGQAKKKRDYETADAIREELKEDFNVFIDDREKEWRVNRSDFNNRNDEYDQGGDTSDDVDVDFEAEMDKFESVLSEEISNAVEEDEEEAAEEEAAEEEEDEEVEEPEEESTTLSAEELTSLTVLQLKEKLRENGLAVSGKKAELVDRLLSGV